MDFPITPPLSLQSASAIGSTSAPTTTSGTFSLIPEMTVTVATRGRPVVVVFSGAFEVRSTLTIGDMVEVALFLDGVEIPGTAKSIGASLGVVSTTFEYLSCQARVTPTSASHTYEARWRRPSGAGTARCYLTQRTIFAQELEA